MKKRNLTIGLMILAVALFAFTAPKSKLVSTKTHIKFFSHTSIEDIEANNYASVSTIDKETGDVVFSVPMQSFEFEKALMQKHFNNDKFLDTKKFPKSKLKAKITNLSDIDFSKDGSYDAKVEGKLTLKGVTNDFAEKGTIIVKGDEVEIQSKFKIKLADYSIQFTGKVAPKIAEILDITVKAKYKTK